MEGSHPGHVNKAPDSSNLVHVMDRESYAYEIGSTLNPLGQDHVVRRKYDRVDAENALHLSDIC